MPSSRKVCIIPGCDHLHSSSVSLLNKLLETVERDGEWAWLQRQWTRPQSLRAENTAYFFKILIPYFINLAFFLAFKFGWVVNNTFFCGVTNSEHTFNIDFTQTYAHVFRRTATVHTVARRVWPDERLPLTNAIVSAALTVPYLPPPDGCQLTRRHRKGQRGCFWM